MTYKSQGESQQDYVLFDHVWLKYFTSFFTVNCDCPHSLEIFKHINLHTNQQVPSSRTSRSENVVVKSQNKHYHDLFFSDTDHLIMPAVTKIIKVNEKNATVMWSAPYAHDLGHPVIIVSIKKGRGIFDTLFRSTHQHFQVKSNVEILTIVELI